jgi:hypothetical protein
LKLDEDHPLNKKYDFPLHDLEKNDTIEVNIRVRNWRTTWCIILIYNYIIYK